MLFKYSTNVLGTFFGHSSVFIRIYPNNIRTRYELHPKMIRIYIIQFNGMTTTFLTTWNDLNIKTYRKFNL